ncbi:UDP-glycosyltransferase UGT5-like isoform X1 [Daktulosphaira vitifoliae]|uniref:UDP-glycosyltransferase UGT5-like isoform X1 n=1 Tax=Daktulosphaira vitifoliae TaxID=58002 RepID=UPI0021AAB228|nr:UDP-glycosyltransferase UGT5-like isoform X1 [Daktulosphaira vitifoliae]XP_050524532.1 UDP-glycosyltransferase UGT5-like isoform X1 [Daktulosphaira vitifoliae]
MKLVMLQLLIIMGSIIQNVSSYNILAIFPFSAKSHFYMFQMISEALAARGHNITVVSHFPKTSINTKQGDWKGVYNDYSIKDSVPIYENLTTELVIGNGFIREMLVILDDGIDNCEGVMSSGRLNDLMRTKTKYDLVIVEIFNTACFVSAASRFGAPLIGVTSTSFYPWYSDMMGNIINPSYIPVNLLPFTTRMPFVERLINTITLSIIRLMYLFKYKPNAQAIVDKYLGKAHENKSKGIDAVNAVIMNTHFTFSDPRPNTPGIIQVGGCTFKTPKSLPQDLEQYITSATRGIIYFSMGSILKGASLPADQAQAFLGAFNRLPPGYKVLWKWEDDPPFGFRQDIIKFVSWTPQFDVLNHPNVKLFISHCGLLGILDALYSGVPIMGIPMFADQFSNMNYIIEKGCGKHLEYDMINEDVVYNKIIDMLSDKRYSTNAKRLSTLFKDRQNNPLQEALFWIEYVAKYGGHLLKPSELPWYLLFSMDIIILISIIFTMVIYLIRNSLHITWSMTQRLWSKSSLQKAKTK